MIFPTGKKHTSFSEVRTWKECSWRHKLAHIDKIKDFDEPSPYLDFGTCAHEGAESLLKGEKIDRDRLIKTLTAAWEKHGFEDPEWYLKQPSWYKHQPLATWVQWVNNMWDEIPAFLDKEFPGWEYIKAEESLYEAVENKNLSFKGFIDGVIGITDKNGNEKVLIIDWKTSNANGWRKQKKEDILMTAQLALYKIFWSQKHGVPLDDIQCGFVLLRRGGKEGKVCEFVSVSTGEKLLAKSLKMVNDMISSVRRGMFLKNRNSCKYCQFKDTKYCT
tara:strand:+ start:2095 stop:2919 length:825 start_codon:yes stop_codon:yes gene_type:complete